MRFEYYKDKSNEWRWRIVASNGRIIADGAEGYKTRSACVNSVYRVQRAALERSEVREVEK